MNETGLKQTDQPLFSDILWSRPVNKKQAGSLLIIGGSEGNFSQIQRAYQIAVTAGIGSCKVAVASSLQPLLKQMENCLFVSSTPSGSISRHAYEDLSAFVQEADISLISPDIGFNNETMALVERLVSETNKPMILSGEVVEKLTYHPDSFNDRPQTAIIVNLNQLQRVASALKLPLAFSVREPWFSYLNKIFELQSKYSRADWIIIDQKWIHVASDHKVSSTTRRGEIDPAGLAAISAVLWTQNQGQPFEALTTAAYLAAQSSSSDQLKELLQKYE